MEKIPASTTTQKGKDPEIPKRKSDLQNEAPKPAEKKIFKAGIIDMQELVDAQARDIGDARMTEDKEDLGKNWLTRNLKRIWKHNMAQEYYRQKEISKIKEQILKTGNLYEGEQVAGGDGANPDHSNIAKKAIIDKFTSDYADEILKKEEKDSTKSDNKFINNKMKDLINEYASGSISEEEFKQKKQDTIELYNPNYTKDGTLYADNLLDIAKEVKDAVDNGQALDKMDFEVNLTLGKARESLDTEAKKTTFDKILNHPIVSKYAIVQTLMQSVAVAGVYSATKYLATGLGRKGAKWLGFGVGMAAGAAIEGAKERARVTRERSQHIRERAKGMQMTEQGMKRREQMEKNRYETKGATEIIGNLDTALAQVGRGNLTESEVREIMTNLSDLEARVRVGGEEKIDLISYESFKNVEKDRTSLLIKAAELKVALRKAGLQMNGNFDDNLESLVDKQRDGFIEEKGTKDEVFRKMRNKKMWAKMGQTLLVGSAFSFAAQEVTSLFTHEDGIAEGTVKGIRNHFDHTPGKGMAHDATAMEAFRRWVTGDGPRMPMGAGVDYNINGANLHLPEGASLVQHADGHGYDLIAGGKTISGVDFDSHGNLTPESIKLLHNADIYPDVSTVGEHTTETVTRTAEDYMKQNPAGTEHVHFKDWMGNNTEMHPDPNHPGHLLGADLNELRTHWTGVNGTGIDANGDYVMSVAHMTNDGSFQDGLSVAAHEQMAAGKLEMILSATKEGQHHVFRIPINPDGTVTVDHNSIAGQMLYSVDSHGHAQYDGAFLQIANPNGVAEDGLTNMQLLGALEGTGHPHDVTETIINDTRAPDIRFSIPLGTEIEPPYPLPYPPRRPMERMNYKDKDKKQGPAKEKKVDKATKIKETADKIPTKEEKVVPVNEINEDQKVPVYEGANKKAAIEKEFADFVAANPNEKIPEEMENRYRLAEQEEVLDNNLINASAKERELFKEFEDFEAANPTEKIPQDLEDRYAAAEANLENARKERNDFLENLNKTPNEINDEEYNNFVDNNLVSDERLNKIADKVINQKEMDSREQAIFAAKTTEINEKIRNIADETTPEVSSVNTTESVESDKDRETREALDQDQEDLENKVKEAKDKQEKAQKKVDGVIKRKNNKTNKTVPPTTQKKLDDANSDLEKAQKELSDFLETRADLENNK